MSALQGHTGCIPKSEEPQTRQSNPEHNYLELDAPQQKRKKCARTVQMRAFFVVDAKFSCVNYSL